MCTLSASSIHALLERIDGLLAEGSEDRLLEQLRSLQPPLVALEQKMGTDGGEEAWDEADSTLARRALYLTSREFLCGLDETTYNGGCPESLEMTGMQHSVARGKGGWGTAEQTFSVRGRDYLQDDVKYLSRSPLFFTRGLQMFKIPTLTRHVASMPWCPIPRGDGQEWLVVNYMVPGTPPIQVVCYYTATKEALDALHNLGGDSPEPVAVSPPPSSPKKKSKGAPQHAVGDGWKNALKGFWMCDKEYCDQRFKLIPNVVHGPWPLKMAIGSKPALTGTKLAQYYYRGENYLEVDIDIGSSSVAANILSLVRDGSKRLTLDIAITIQGNSAEELPERILCQTRWVEMDFGKAGAIAS